MSKRRCSNRLHLLFSLWVLLGFLPLAHAQKAAIVTATRSSESAWWQSVKARILATGLYTAVDQVDAAFRDPTLAQLQDYKLVVVVASDYGLSSGDGVGNALGDYMAMVPGAAVLVFQPNTWQTGLSGAPAIGGKFLANYALTSQSGSNTASATKRGTVLANDPLVEGVTEFSCGSNCVRVTGTSLRAGATAVAYWADGTLLAVRGKKRVDLNMLPADESVITGSWGGTGADLITNAILYLSAPMLQSPRKPTFPSVGLGGATGYTAITFRNISDAAIDVTEIGIDGTGKAQFVYKSDYTPSVASPVTLAIGATLTVQVAFKPQVQGTHRASLYLSLNGLPRLDTPLEGTSKGNLWISLSPIDFGGIASGGTAGPVTVRLKNAGTNPIDLEKPTVGDATHYQLVTSRPDAKITMFSGATYSFDLKFTPGADTGEFLTDVTVISTDASSPLVIPVRGLAGPPKAKLPYSSVLMPDVPMGSKGTPITINVTNEGFSDLSIPSISTDSTDFEVPNAPTVASPLVVPAKEMKTFQIVFSPTKAGLRTGKLTLTSNEPPGSPGSDKTIDLAGTATQPQFKVNATALDFGAVQIGTPVAAKTVELSNDGDGDLLVKEVAIAAGVGADSFSVSTLEATPFVLRAGSKAVAQVTIGPKSAGTLSATLRIATDLLTGGAATVALKATVSGAVGQLDTAKLDFGDSKVKQVVQKTLKLNNVGNQDLTILKSALSPTVTVFSLTAPADGTKIPAGGSATFTVGCIPAVVGSATARLDISTDDPATAGGTKFSVPLSVNGVVANVTLDPVALDFTTPIYVGQKSEMKSFKVTNTGSVTVDNLAVKLSGDGAADFTVVTGYKTKILPGEQSEIGLTFDPRTAKAEIKAVAIVDADGVQVPMNVALKGSAMSAMLTVTPTTLRFRNVYVGEQSQPMTVSIANEGTGALELDVVPPATDEWTVDTSGAKLSLGPGESTKFAVVFSPKTIGNKSELLDIRMKGSVVSLSQVSIEGDGMNRPAPVQEESGCAMTRGQAAWPGLALLLVGMCVLVRRRKRWMP
ncbi:MAG TPA: choice-of-anchor D domain-containing protein [Pseudomonadota bacterium]|nr:choice-of-anchor D domain-containing protein [Pseudomonadota bacterium]